MEMQLGLRVAMSARCDNARDRRLPQRHVELQARRQSHDGRVRSVSACSRAWRAVPSGEGNCSLNCTNARDESRTVGRRRCSGTTPGDRASCMMVGQFVWMLAGAYAEILGDGAGGSTTNVTHPFRATARYLYQLFTPFSNSQTEKF